MSVHRNQTASPGKTLYFRVILPLWRWIHPQIKLGSLLVAGLVLWFAFYQLRQIRRNVILLEPVAVPQQYADLGYSSEVITQRVRDRLQAIEDSEETATSKDRLSGQPYSAYQNIEIPDTGIPLRAVADFLQQAFGDERRHLASSITLAPPDKSGKRGTILWYRVAGASDEGAFTKCPEDATDPEKATEALADCFMLQVNPYTLGVYYFEKADPADGERVAQFMKSQHSPDRHFTATSQILLGYAEKSKGNWYEAEQHYLAAMDLEPNLPNPHLMMADLLGSRIPPDVDWEIDELHTAIQLDRRHESTAAHINLGNLLAKLPGKLENAIAEYQIALAIDPGSARAHANLGDALCDDHEQDKGIDEIKKAISISPDSAEAHLYLGSCLLVDENQVPQAMEELEFANQLSPGIGNVYELLGKGFEQQGDMKDAIESYRQACAASPNDGKLRGHLEELARKQGAPPPKSSPPSKSAAR